MTNEQIKHLEFIQDVVTRMNSSSFQIKGWCITILSALCAIYATNKNVSFIGIALLPTILFWGMDAYYLQQERKFRGLHRDVSKGDSDIRLFSMSVNNYVGGKYSFWASFKSRTILGLYGTLTILLIIAVAILCKGEFPTSICNCK